MSVLISQSSRPYCNATFVAEGSIGEDGEPIKLKRCAQCRGAFYVSREAQRSHWTVHKKFCKSPDAYVDLKRRIFSLSGDEATEHLRDVLLAQRVGNQFFPDSPSAGYSYLWVLQRLEQLSREGKDSNTDPLRHVLSAVFLLPNEQIERLWAVPGMAEYLLNLDIRSDVIKEGVSEDPEGRPSMEMQEARGFQGKFQLTPNYCDLVCSLLAGSAVCEPARPYLRETAFSIAATRKVMAWLEDTWSLVSIPKSLLGHKHMVWEPFFYLLVQLCLHHMPGDPEDPTAIAPGLTIEGASKVVINCIAASHNELEGPPFEQWVECLFMAAATRPIAWAGFSVSRRANLGFYIQTHFIFGDFDLKPEIMKCCELIVDFVMGWNVDIPLWMKVVKASREEFGSDAIFFQRWLDRVLNERSRPSVKEFLTLSGVSLPDDVETSICEFALKLRTINIVRGL